MEVMVRLEGAASSILEVFFDILELTLLAWMEIREEVLTDIVTRSN